MCLISYNSLIFFVVSHKNQAIYFCLSYTSFVLSTTSLVLCFLYVLKSVHIYCECERKVLKRKAKKTHDILTKTIIKNQEDFVELVTSSSLEVVNQFCLMVAKDRNHFHHVNFHEINKTENENQLFQLHMMLKSNKPV